MDDSLLMDINHSFYNLTNINPSLKLSQPLPPLTQIFQSIIPAILQQDVDIFFILEGIYKFDNIFMLQ